MATALTVNQNTVYWPLSLVFVLLNEPYLQNWAISTCRRDVMLLSCTNSHVMCCCWLVLSNKMQRVGELQLHDDETITQWILCFYFSTVTIPKEKRVFGLFAMATAAKVHGYASN